MGPESFFHRIGDVFGFKDIDFDEEPGFSGCYLLKGNDSIIVIGGGICGTCVRMLQY